MPEAYIIDAVRTATGRRGGGFAAVPFPPIWGAEPNPCASGA